VRAVLDTNVVISGTLTPHGACGQILDLLVEGLFEVCADDRILDEYEEVLSRPELAIRREDSAVIVGWLRSIVRRAAAVPLSVKLPDPDDLVFLEVASSAGAILVTGNLRHYPGRLRAGVTVLSPAEFLEVLRRSS
jgi:putative PIN family toxin of toxin-antitoxin system